MIDEPLARKAPGKYCNAYSVLLFALFSESSVHHGLWGNLGHRQWKKLGNEHAKEAREEARGRRKEIWCLCRKGYRAFRVRNCVDEYSFLLNLRQCLIGRSWSTGWTSLARARKRFPGLEKAPSSRLSQPMSFIYIHLQQRWYCLFMSNVFYETDSIPNFCPGSGKCVLLSATNLEEIFEGPFSLIMSAPGLSATGFRALVQRVTQKHRRYL